MAPPAGWLLLDWRPPKPAKGHAPVEPAGVPEVVPVVAPWLLAGCHVPDAEGRVVAEVGATVVACTLPVCVVVVVVEGAVATTVAGAGVVEEAAAGLLLTALPTLAAVAALSWHCCVLLLQTWDELEQQLAPQAIWVEL